ncbi:MAG TPA: ABC transporter substrate-binding protein, partial [Candidatus Acidoferrum sp.]|nr:ABC transporter substrate-binding protein [Candidatus Acidoferrum sp.]
NVHVMIGSYQSATTIVTTEVAERYKTPWVILASVSDRITGRGFKYVFRPCNMAVYDANEQLQAIKYLTEVFGKGPKAYGLLVEGTEWGKSHAENVRKLVKEQSMGYELVLDEAYPPGQADFSPQILKIRSKKPDFLIVAMYTPDHILFNRQVMEQKLDLPFGLHSVVSGAEDPAFYKALPVQAVDYMFVQEDYQIDITDVAPWTQAIDKKTREILGYEMNAYVAQGYSNAYIIADALERAGSADKDKIRDALAKTNITSGPALITGYQKIAFDATGQNVDSHGVISENFKGRRSAIWPVANRHKDTKPVWPIPAWKDR